MSSTGASRPSSDNMLTVERYGDVERVILWTRRSMSVGYHVSAYMTRGVVIDTGFPSMARELAAWLQATKPRASLLTHAHEDHAGNVDVFARLGIPMQMAPVTLAELQGASRPGLYRLLVWGQPRRVPRNLTPGAIDEPALTLVPTPGHSADHHVVWDAERENLYGGDLFLGVKVRVLAPWEDPRAHAASLRAVIALRPKRLFDAHRGLILDPVGILTAKADWMEGTIAAIEGRLAEGWSHSAIAREVLGPEHSLRYLTAGEYSHRNFVATVASPPDPVPSRTRPT
jgi:glyoxylase-like metal-dependent hydrolase (beta-lactamase superfamily II)